MAIALESLVPEFLDEEDGMEAPMLFQVVCGTSGSSVVSAGHCKSVSGDDMLDHWSHGVVRDARAHAVVPWEMRPEVWRCLSGRCTDPLGVDGMAILSLSMESGGFRVWSAESGDLRFNLSALGEQVEDAMGDVPDGVSVMISIPHSIRELDVRRDTAARIAPGDDGLLLRKDGETTLISPGEAREMGMGAEEMVEAIHEMAGVRRGSGKVCSFKTQDLVAPWRLVVEGRR